MAFSDANGLCFFVSSDFDMGSVFFISFCVDLLSSSSNVLLARSPSVTEFRMPHTSMSAFMESEVVVSSIELWHWYWSSIWPEKVICLRYT